MTCSTLTASWRAWRTDERCFIQRQTSSMRWLGRFMRPRRRGQVRLEIGVIPVEAQRMFLDIWLPVEGVAIELKYKTRGLELEQDDESFALRDQSAQDQGRYDFLRDIQRLELMRSKLEQGRAGYAVLLTNDSLILEGSHSKGHGGHRLSCTRGAKNLWGIGVGGPGQFGNGRGSEIADTDTRLLSPSLAGVFQVPREVVRHIPVSRGFSRVIEGSDRQGR